MDYKILLMSRSHGRAETYSDWVWHSSKIGKVGHAFYFFCPLSYQVTSLRGFQEHHKYVICFGIKEATLENFSESSHRCHDSNFVVHIYVSSIIGSHSNSSVLKAGSFNRYCTDGSDLINIWRKLQCRTIFGWKKCEKYTFFKWNYQGFVIFF